MNTLEKGYYNQKIEESVKKIVGCDYKVEKIVTNKVGAMHDNAIFKGNNLDIFVKAGTNTFSFDQFTQEAWGLNYISKNSPITTPKVIDIVMVDNTSLLIMEAIDVKPVESKKDWEVLGRGLATLHKTTWNQCGLETHSYLGVFRQNNSPEKTWADFYGERRLRDSMKMAVDAGNMTKKHCKEIEKLIVKLPEICGTEESFSLLHGDPWPGNLLYDGKEMVAIDCSIYYGNREIDLSTVDFFFPVPEHFFDAYNEVYPIEPGYSDRKALWQINQWLGHVTLFGEKYIPKLMNAVNEYI